jgi:BTB/POZ domain-containing protein 9
MRETNYTKIELKEAKANAFGLLLQYIYTGKINNLRNEKEELLIDFLTLAHQFGFIELQKSISDYLESILDLKNVCSIYDISCLYNLKSLTEKCARFIDKHCIALVKSSSLLCLSCESLAAIIERDSFCLPEIEILNLVREWHEQNGFKEQNQTKSELVDRIRLPLMKLEELFNDVRQSNLIIADKILDAIKLKHESKHMDLRYRGVLCNNF